MSEPVKFFFACACGCGQISDPLGKDYVRLPKGCKWYAKGCSEGSKGKEFKSGIIAKQEDF